MKKTLKLIKKTFIIISVIWTIITLCLIGLRALSGPASCSVDVQEDENASRLTGELPHETIRVKTVPLNRYDRTA